MSQTPSPANDQAGGFQPWQVGVIVAAVGVLAIVAIVLAVLFLRRKRNQYKDSGTPASQVSLQDFELFSGSQSPTVNTIGTSKSGNTTILNTQYGHIITLPGFLRLDYHQDMRSEKLIARGGGGAIHFGRILNPDARSKFAFCADSIAIKTLTIQPDLKPETALAMFHQEVSVMKYAPSFSFSSLRLSLTLALFLWKQFPLVSPQYHSAGWLHGESQCHHHANVPG